jgi:endonuclease III
MIQISKEDSKITKSFEGDDKSQLSYSESSHSNSSIDTFESYNSTNALKASTAIGKNKANKKAKKPSFSGYLSRFGEEHANVWQTYTLWKRQLATEKIGTIRDLYLEEITYFQFAKKYYENIPTKRKGLHNFHNPPQPWLKRYNLLQKPPKPHYKVLIDAMLTFVKTSKECSNAERSNWNDVLGSLPMGSLDRVLWSVAFLKSTNGVADKVSCAHFRELIKKSQPIRLDLYKRPLAIAAMLRQTSKWVKNTFVLTNIFQHIEQEWNGIPSQDFSEWLMFHEIGPKTGSLIFHAAFGKMMTLPVDSHVWHAFRKWDWTNAKSTDECSWQASQWMDQSYFIATNDAIGAIRQTLANWHNRKVIHRQAEKLDPEVFELISKLI